MASFVERAVRFGRRKHLIGVMGGPPAQEANAPAVVFLNSGIIHRVGANRIYVRLARALAEEGIPSLRFDFSGIGDSGHPEEAGSPALAEIARRDIQDSFSLLESQGFDRFIPAGLCSGATNAFETVAAEHRTPGAILLDPYPFAFLTAGDSLRSYWRRVSRPRSLSQLARTSSATFVRMAKSVEKKVLPGDTAATQAIGLADHALNSRQAIGNRLRAAMDRGTHLLVVFTAGLEYRYTGIQQLFDAFPDVDFGDRVELEYFPDSDHRFSPEDAQRRLESLVVEWCGSDRIPVARRGKLGASESKEPVRPESAALSSAISR